MNFKQMILVNELLANILDGSYKPTFKLAFELDDSLYTGEFTVKNQYDETAVTNFEPSLGIFNPKPILDREKKQQLRSSLFRHVFGEDFSVGDRLWYQYTENLKHLVLNDVINVISSVDIDEYFPENLQVPEIIFNLENIHTGQKLDYYIASDKTFKPVTLIELISEDTKD